MSSSPAILIAALLSVILMMVVLFMRSSLLRAYRALAHPFSQIAQAIKELNMGQAGEIIETAAVEESKENPPVLVSAPLGASDSLEHFNEVQEKLIGSVEDVDQAYVIEILNSMLSSQGDVARGVYILEMLPRELARELFDKLGTYQKEQVREFLSNSVHPKNKMELMLEAGEEFITKLLKGQLGAINQHLRQEIFGFIQQLNPDQMVEVIKSLSTEAACRFLLYLNPPIIASILGKAHRVDFEWYQHLSQGFVRLNEYEQRNDLDDLIEQALKDYLEQDAKNTAKKYLPIFKEVLASLEDEQTEGLLEMFKAVQQDIAATLSSSILTLGTYFKLAPQYQKDLLDRLSNSEIVALSSLLNEEQNKILGSHLGARRLEMIMDERERFEQFSYQEIRKRFVAARKKLVALMRKMVQEEGPLDVLLNQTPKAQNQQADLKEAV